MKQLMKKSILALATFACLQPEATSQCNSWDAFPAGVEDAKAAHVRYRDAFKAQRYDEAFKEWEGLFAHVQKPSEAPTRHFMDGAYMLFVLAQKEQDTEKKAALLQRLIDVYEAHFECNPDKASGLDRAYQGYYMFYLGANPKETVKVFEKSYKMDEHKTKSMVIAPWAQLAVYLFEQGDSDYNAERVRELYEKFKRWTEKQTSNNMPGSEEYSQAWKGVQEAYSKIEDKIFDCNYYVEKLRPTFEKDKQDQEQNKSILQELQYKGKCETDNAFYQEVYAIYGPWKREQDSLEMIANFDNLSNAKKAAIRENESKLDEAYDWYRKALDDEDLSNEEKGKIAHRIAYHEFKDKKNFSVARSYCRKASQYLPNWGEPYLLVGLMYAASGKACSPETNGTGWNAQVVVWAAMDEWQRAKSVDPNATTLANKYIGEYSAYYPSSDEGFQRGIKAGSSYKVGCWIGVTTTVRYKN